jgi:hypothetical protein
MQTTPCLVLQAWLNLSHEARATGLEPAPLTTDRNVELARPCRNGAAAHVRHHQLPQFDRRSGYHIGRRSLNLSGMYIDL